MYMYMYMPLPNSVLDSQVGVYFHVASFRFLPNSLETTIMSRAHYRHCNDLYPFTSNTAIESL